MTDTMTDMSANGIANFVCSRDDLAPGRAADEVARRAGEQAVRARTLVSVRFIRPDGVGCSDVFVGTDRAVVHTRLPDTTAPADGMLLEAAALPLVLGEVIVRETGRWPLGGDGSSGITTLDGLTEAVRRGELQWAIIASRADRADDRIEKVQVVASDGVNLMTGETGSQALSGTPVTVAMGRLLSLLGPDE